jgi:hypothetical protein
MSSFCFWSICIRSASLVRSVPVPAEGPLDVGHETVQSTSESPHHNTRNGCPAVLYFRRVLPAYLWPIDSHLSSIPNLVGRDTKSHPTAPPLDLRSCESTPEFLPSVISASALHTPGLC